MGEPSWSRSSVALTASCVPLLLAAMLQMGPPQPSMERATHSRARSYSVMSPLRPAPKSRSPAAQHSASTDRVSCPGITWGGKPVTLLHSPVQPGTAKYGLVLLGTAQYSSVWPSMAQYGQVQPSTARYGLVWPSMARHSSVRPGMARYSQVQPGTAQFG